MRQRPPDYTARYAVAFDTMANCLAAKWANMPNTNVLPQVYQREQRAAVTLIITPSNVIAGDYQIKTNADSTIDVEWRWFAGSGRAGRERADLCGRT